MNSQTARERILKRLAASGTEHTAVPDADLPQPPSLNAEERVTRLAAMMEAMRTEVHVVDAADWADTFRQLAREKGWRRVLYGPRGPVASPIEAAWSADDGLLPDLVAYSDSVEAFKADLFETIDAGVTSVRGAVADTGALVLWPDAHEPRLMSLAPPVHVAVLDADRIFNSLGEMMAAEKWADGMPTNALMISGPSKTADIEFTLVFGVHGPKELVVLIRQ